MKMVSVGRFVIVDSLFTYQYLGIKDPKSAVVDIVSLKNFLTGGEEGNRAIIFGE